MSIFKNQTNLVLSVFGLIGGVLVSVGGATLWLCKSLVSPSIAPYVVPYIDNIMAVGIITTSLSALLLTMQ